MDVTKCFWSALLCTVSLCGSPNGLVAAEEPSSSAAATPSVSNATANPFANLKQDELISAPGTFDRRIKLNRQPSVDAGFVPPPQPSLSLKEMMRLRDQQEEKKNWMFLDSGSLTEKREKQAEDEIWKDRYDKKEDMRKKGWWEYQKDTSAVGLIMGKKAPKEGLERKELEAEFQAKINGQGRSSDDEDTSSKRATTRSLLFGSGSDRGSRDSGHQNSDLDSKNLFSTELLPDRNSQSALGLKELLGSDPRSLEERSAAAGRREDFRSFLNVSRLPAASPQSRNIEPPVPNPVNLQPPSFEVNGSKVTPSEFFSPSTAAAAQRFGSPGFSFDGASANGRALANAAPTPSFRVSPAAAPSYITPEMMKQQKRRF